MDVLTILIADSLMVGTEVEGRFQFLGMAHKQVLRFLRNLHEFFRMFQAFQLFQWCTR